MRVGVYIDGFNLYFGILQKRWRDVLWLNLEQFSAALLKAGQSLTYVKYFTARISGPPDKRKRQETFIEAVGTLPKVQTYFGKYRAEKRTCRSCHSVDWVPREKMTDVNIATEILVDAYDDRCDLVMLVGGDSDLVPPLAAVKRLFSSKRVVVAFPPARNSKELEGVAHGYIRVDRSMLLRSQFPEEVTKSNGHTLHRPAKWT